MYVGSVKSTPVGGVSRSSCRRRSWQDRPARTAAPGEQFGVAWDGERPDFLYHPPSDEWVRNVSSASRGALTTCAGPGDSGGAVFSTVSGGVQAAGIFSGFLVCRIYFTPIYDTFLALPGDVLLH